MSEKFITSHNLGFLHSRPVSLAVSNNNPKTLQAFSALVGLVVVAHLNKDLVCTGRLDVVQHHSDFVTVMVFGEDATTTDPDIDKPEFVVLFVESGRMLEMLLLREPDNRPQLLNTGEDAPFGPIDRSLMLTIVKKLDQEIDHHSQTVTVHNPVTRSFVSRRWGTVGSLMNTRNQALCYATVDAAMAEIAQEESHVK